MMSDLPWTEKSTFFPPGATPKIVVDPTGIAFAAWVLDGEMLRISFFRFGPERKRTQEVLSLGSERFKKFGLDAASLQHLLLGLWAGNLYIFLVDARGVVGVRLSSSNGAWSFLGRTEIDHRWKVFRTIERKFDIQDPLRPQLWGKFLGQGDSFQGIWKGKMEVFFRGGSLLLEREETFVFSESIVPADSIPLLGVSRLGIPANTGFARSLVGTEEVLHVLEDAWGVSWAVVPWGLRKLPHWPSSRAKIVTTLLGDPRTIGNVARLFDELPGAEGDESRS